MNMLFDDWQFHTEKKISPTILWEYNLSSPFWDWEKMATTVIKRVIEYGTEEDYYAAFNIYGGKNNVREIIKKIPHLERREIIWVCFIFDLKEEELLCSKKKQYR